MYKAFLACVAVIIPLLFGDNSGVDDCPDSCAMASYMDIFIVLFLAGFGIGFAC